MIMNFKTLSKKNLLNLRVLCGLRDSPFVPRTTAARRCETAKILAFLRQAFHLLGANRVYVPTSISA